MERIEAFDFLRGILLILVILFHASVYNYANINKIDFSNPPISVVIISFLTLWGGLIIFYSAMINTIMTLRRNNTFYTKFLFYAGVIYLVINYVINIFLGRWANDFVNNKPDMTMVANIIRNSQISFPHISKWFEGSSLMIIGINLIFLSFFLYLLLKNEARDYKKQYWVLGILGFVIMFVSFIRIFLYPLIEQSILQHNYVLATILSYTVANPYPILPYLAYGLFASMAGIMIWQERFDLIKKVMIPIASFFTLFGLVGMLQFEKTISKADYFWYFKTHFELGVFILITVFVTYLYLVKHKEFKWAGFIKNFSTISLTIYLLEVTLSELFGKTLTSFLPMWNQTINGCLLFGFVNVMLWGFILMVWSKFNFKYSFEYFWVIFFSNIGKTSTKIFPLIEKQEGGNGLPPPSKGRGIRPKVL
jgi:hypothetical protein